MAHFSKRRFHLVSTVRSYNPSIHYSLYSGREQGAIRSSACLFARTSAWPFNHAAQEQYLLLLNVTSLVPTFDRARGEAKVK